MKKVFALVLAALMAVTMFAGCGASEPAATEAPAAADFKVGAIYINSKNDTAGYTFAHQIGRASCRERV